MSNSLSGWITGHPTSGKVECLNQVISLDCLARDRGLSIKNLNCDWPQQTSKGKGARSRDGSSDQKACEQVSTYWTRRSRSDQSDSYRALYKHPPPRNRVKFLRDSPNLNYVRVWHWLESTWKSATRPTDGYTSWAKFTIRNRRTLCVSRSSRRHWIVGIDSSHERSPLHYVVSTRLG